MVKKKIKELTKAELYTKKDTIEKLIGRLP
jgi:hypothetical protein